MLSKKQRFARRGLLTKIHTCKAYKDIKHFNAWEDWLNIRYGVNSCKQLSIGELKLVADELIKGAAYMHNKPDIKGRMLLKDDCITTKQLTYMKSLWEQKSINKDENSLLKFSSRVIGKQYLYLALMTSVEATNVISVLERKL